MKNIKAFTLIELIVVIAIIGVLAAILVPSMIGYVGESKLSSANANAKIAYENSAVYATTCETYGHPVPREWYCVDLRHTTFGQPYEKNGEDLENALKSMMGSQTSSGGLAYVVMDASMCKETKWVKTPNDKYVGSYPGAFTTKTGPDNDFSNPGGHGDASDI